MQNRARSSTLQTSVLPPHMPQDAPATFQQAAASPEETAAPAVVQMESQEPTASTPPRRSRTASPRRGASPRRALQKPSAPHPLARSRARSKQSRPSGATVKSIGATAREESSYPYRDRIPPPRQKHQQCSESPEPCSSRSISFRAPGAYSSHAHHCPNRPAPWNPHRLMD